MNRCLYGGTCVDGEDFNYKCNCLTGFSGNDCQDTRINISIRQKK